MTTIEKKHGRFVVLMGIALILCTLASFTLGRYPVPLGKVLGILGYKLGLPITPYWTNQMEAAVWNIRLPRILLSILVGACLAAAGGAYQGVFQNPMASLDPVMRTGRQVAEALPPGRSRREKIRRVKELYAAVGLDPSLSERYPCELSGGQCQRVMIATAVAAEPELLIADEPTTALDVTTQREVLDLIERVSGESGAAVLLITHNLGLVSRYSDFVNVMYAGEIVESGKVAEVLSSPRHPYTSGLIAAVPRLDAPKDAPLSDIPGTVPPPWDWPKGCAFHPRCPHAVEECSSEDFSICRFRAGGICHGGSPAHGTGD